MSLLLRLLLSHASSGPPPPPVTSGRLISVTRSTSRWDPVELVFDPGSGLTTYLLYRPGAQLTDLERCIYSPSNVEENDLQTGFAPDFRPRSTYAVDSYGVVTMSVLPSGGWQSARFSLTILGAAEVNSP